MRKLKDYWFAPEAAKRISGSPDLYSGQYRGYNSSINFLTCHDGFTLYDLYSYNNKHNEANGWNNTDGGDDNRSWNCGAEGETRDEAVTALRRRMIKNACAVLMCSRGTPMFLAGDEFGNTQSGNNNPYCQDNEISWLDWSDLEKNRDIFEFFQYMIAFRKSHPAIRGNCLPSAMGFPAVSVHGGIPWKDQITTESRYLGIMFAGQDPANKTGPVGMTESAGREDLVYLAVNVHWEDQTFRLPELPDGFKWRLAVNTASPEPKECCRHSLADMPAIDSEFTVRPRSVAVFTGIGGLL